MFAGPNGSGKSTLKSVLRPEWVGVYINPDDIERELRASGQFALPEVVPPLTTEDIHAFFRASTLMQRRHPAGVPAAYLAHIQAEPHAITARGLPIDSYLASVLSDLLRQHLIYHRVSLSFETVMSSKDKLSFLDKAHAQGYRIYLYFIATESPTINIARVQERVYQGGHNVPPDKIVERYWRCLDLLIDAISKTDRCYLFDNSGAERIFIAEITGGVTLDIKVTEAMYPGWFRQYVLDDSEPEIT